MSLNNANKSNVSSMITNNNNVTMVKTELEDKLKSVIISDHSKMGKSETHEAYSDKGITITTKHSSGATMTNTGTGWAERSFRGIPSTRSRRTPPS